MANASEERTSNLERQVARLEANQDQFLSMMGQLKAAIDRLTREEAGGSGVDNNNVVEAMELGGNQAAAVEDKDKVTAGAEERMDVAKGEKNKDKAGAKERMDMGSAKFGSTDIR